jgi:hypothetical protein
MVLSGSILADRKKTEIIEYMKIMGTDWELLVEKLLAQIEEKAKGQPVAAMLMIGEFVTYLGRQDAQHKLSLHLVDEARPGWEAQLGKMEAEIGRLCEALSKGNMAGIVRGHKTLTSQLDKYYGGLEATRDWENVSSDSMELWWRVATELTLVVLEMSGRYMGRGAEQQADPLAPLRRG